MKFQIKCKLCPTRALAGFYSGLHGTYICPPDGWAIGLHKKGSDKAVAQAVYFYCKKHSKGNV